MLKTNPGFRLLTPLLVPSLVLTLFLAIGCSKKKVEEETAGGETPTEDTQISDREMRFDTQGSDSGTIAGLKTIYFPYDSANLTPDTREALSGNAAWLKENPNFKLQIEGHCDNRGSIEYNLALGERRAKSVRTYLINLGVAANRLSIISYGKEKPIVSGDSEEAYAKNRRANFLPLGK